MPVIGRSGPKQTFGIEEGGGRRILKGGVREEERQEIQRRLKKKRRSEGGWLEERKEMTNMEGMEEENLVKWGERRK